MKQKTYKRFVPYGYIKFAANPSGAKYMLLSPQPVVNDSWQRDNQQRWAVGVPDFNNTIKVNGLLHSPYTPVHMVLSVEEAVIVFDPYCSEIYIWDGEYVVPDDVPEATMDEVMAECEDNDEDIF